MGKKVLRVFSSLGLVLSALEVSAVTVTFDFNDSPIGTIPDSLNPYPGGVQIFTMSQGYANIDMRAVWRAIVSAPSEFGPNLDLTYGAINFGPLVYTELGQINDGGDNIWFSRFGRLCPKPAGALVYRA